MPGQIIFEKLECTAVPFPYSMEVCSDVRMELSFHIHPHCQITQAACGKICYVIDEQHVEMQKGDILVINGNIPHACLTEKGAQRRNLGFYPEMLEVSRYCRVYEPFLHILYSNMYPYVILKHDEDAAEEIAGMLDEIFRMRGKEYLSFDGVIHNRIADISISLAQWSACVEKRDMRGIGRDLIRGMEYIEENLTEPITIEDAARAAGLNPSYFSHCFKKNIGISFKQFLNRKRLETAAVELTTTERQITEIAFSCGFGSVTAFYQNFLNFYKLSPKKFRDLNMKRKI